MKSTYLFLLSLMAIAFISCEKNSFTSTTASEIEGQSRLKVNFVSAYRTTRPYQIKLNNVRVSNNLTYLTPFPGGGLNTGGGSTSDYLAVAPGSVNVAISFPNYNTNTDSVQVATATVNLDASKKYSLYFADTAANTTTLLVEDSLSAPDSGYAKYKFINLIPDLPSADLYIGTTKVAAAIPFKGVSPSFTVPTNSSSTTWAIRAAGGTTNLATYASSSSIGNQRVYTVVARGYNAITSTSDPRRRWISLIYNQ